MGDAIRPTPRNALLGWFADRTKDVSDFASKPFGYDNPPGEMMMNALAVPDIASTLNRMSYGGAMTTGSGMTTQLRPDATNALMAVAPVVAKYPRAAVGLAASAFGMDANALGHAATVWHGSPHSFNAFDASKIGTGEGAQAYGHGLYLADNPSVAQEYARMNLSGPGQVAHVGAKNGPDGAMTALKTVYPQMPSEWYQSAISKAEAAGNTYKVDLPDEHIAKMLDWDKPLSQQPASVKQFFEPHVAPIRAEMAKPANPGWGDLAAPSTYDPTGQELLSLMRNRDAPQTAASFLGNGLDSQLSATLRQRGIPGIRYLDGGSRGAGAGSSNYVVFPGNENLLSILERNGQPPK